MNPLVADGRELEAQLQRLRGVRDAAAQQLADVEREIGTVAGHFMEVGEYASYSSIARSLGVSHTFVKTLIDRASDRAKAQRPTTPWRTPFLKGPDAANYVRATGKTIRRVIASFSEIDLLYASKLHPSTFLEEGFYQYLNFPHMMWQLNDDTWVGVESVNVGYGGTGGGYARRALVEAGIDEELAHQISGWRYSDTDVAARRVDGTRIWPKYNLPPPSLITDNYFKMEVEASTLEEHPASVDDTGFYPTQYAGVPFKQLIDYLDRDDLPEWLVGPRVARIFLDDTAAISQGFTDYAAPLVIEQGELQIWLELYRSTDPSHLFDDVVYDALAIAGLYPSKIAEHDRRGFIWRSIDDLRFGRKRPAFYDISQDGRSKLRRIPNPQLGS